MTFTGMSAGYPDCICTFPESRQNKFRTHPAGAGDSDHPYICRILHSAHPCKIGGSVGAPIAEKAYNFYIIFSHYIFFSLYHFTQGKYL
jgi:hypothetical protein